jgi:hypothetical protein
VQIHFDADRSEAERFHARTSGTCLLYDPAGRLEFAGGLTAARGHEGDNDGARSLVALLNGGRSHAESTPVFGCSLLEPVTAPLTAAAQ